MTPEPGAFSEAARYYVAGRPPYTAPQGLFWDWPGDTEIVLATKEEGGKKEGGK